MPISPLAPVTDFPLLTQLPEFSYLDSAATSQKPQVVLDAITNYYTQNNANVHRGVHHLSDASTQVWLEARTQVAQFVGAHPDELIITRNTTEALNGIAYGLGEHNLKEGDVILSTVMEHHANLVPWQQLASRRGARLELVQLTPDGRWDLADFARKLELPQLKLIAVSHVSNALGTLNPIEWLMQHVNDRWSQTAADRPRVALDAAQSVPHLPLSFSKLGLDFLAFSGHKLLAPMGVGVLLARRALIDSGELQPWLFGGGMIAEVHTDHATWHPDALDRFTAGTPDVASVVGLAAAVQYLQKLGMSQVAAHDQELVAYTLSRLQELPQLEIIGPLSERVGSVAFTYHGVHAHDVAQVLDSQGVAVRSGHHCTMPLHQQFGWQASVRASFQVYTSSADVDRLINGLHQVAKVFGT